MMDLIKEFTIMDPPTKYIVRAKNKIDENTNKLKVDTYYLTENLFFGNNAVHYMVGYKIINFCKEFLFWQLQGLPKLTRCRIHLDYYRMETTWDLDNKGFFWIKFVQDLLKTPSNKQLINAQNKGNKIKSLYVIRDDTVKFIDELRVKYYYGEHKMIIRIYGVKEDVQGELNI